MRTTKRFTPQVLQRFARQSRGQGIAKEYIPWHRVSRGDPSSSGRSHWLLSVLGRHHHLLSDLERCCLFFIQATPGLFDVLEQFPIPMMEEPHALLRYGQASPTKIHQGTYQIAQDLKIRHPMIQKGKDASLWQMSTDFFVTQKGHDNRLIPLAISVKPDKPLTNRQKQLLTVEKAYWNQSGVEWLLFTPALYHPQVKLNLERISCWFTPSLSGDTLNHASAIVNSNSSLSLTDILAKISATSANPESAQWALWQAVLFGLLPVDLRIPIRPSRPLQLLPNDDFLALNPIAARRTAWI